MSYPSNHTARLAGFVLAVFLATALHGSMLFQFDQMARDGVESQRLNQATAASTASAHTLTLERVTIVGHQS